MNTKLFKRFFIVYIKSKMEYRFSFFMDIFINIFTYSINYIGIWIILNRFNQIQGWGFYEVMFLYNLNLFSYGLACFFFYTPMRSLEGMIQSGSFDSVLIRPINPFFHLILKQSYHGFLGHVILGIVVFYICFQNLVISWNILQVFYLIFVIIGATLIQSSLMIIAGTINFWFIKANTLMNTFIYGFRNFIEYPLNIYSKILQGILTFIIPYAFINFYPARFFLNKSEITIFHPVLQVLTPLIGILLFGIAYKFWTIGINYYQSTGS